MRLSTGAGSVLDSDNHLRQRPAGNGARRDVSYAYCAHCTVEMLGVGVSVDRELGKPQFSPGSDGVFEQQAANPLADGLRLDEHHAQDACGGPSFEGREAQDVTVPVSHHGSSACDLIRANGELVSACVKELCFITPMCLGPKC